MLGHFTYLIFELGWAVPVIVLQWFVGRRQLWERRLTLTLSVSIATVYLSTVDAVAISQGIWTLHHDRIVDLYVFNVPLEEIVFFLVTSVMVVQSVLLFSLDSPMGSLRRLTLRRR